MKRLETHQIGIAQGDVVLFSDLRQFRSVVRFKKRFKSIPAVRVWLTMWDVSSETNARMDVQSEDETEEGFTIVFRTWGDTKVARVRVGWQAIGELPYADGWTLY